MKFSVVKIVQSYINKKNINNLKKTINIRNLIICVVALLVFISAYYFSRPVVFDYESNKKVFENKISNYLKASSSIEGGISFSFFPRPRIIVENLNVKLNESNNKPLILNKSNFFVPISKLHSPNKIKIKKIYVTEQKIKIYPSQFKNYLEYFQKNNVNNIIFKNCEIFFVDAQSNIISINDFDLKNKFSEKKGSISAQGIFSQNKFKLKFVNQKDQEKYLDFSIPDLNTKLKITFNKESKLEKKSGKLNLKIIDNILMLNFFEDKNYEISNSFFRNKFLNSKIDGKINFKDNFYFDLSFDVNQVNLRKLFQDFAGSENSQSPVSFNISKKINGKAKVKIGRNETYFGRIDATNFILLFENGDIKIKSGSISLGKNAKSKFAGSISGQGKDQKITFFINFFAEDGKNFLKKLNMKTKDNNFSFSAIGTINIMQKKIRFNNLTISEEKVQGRNLSIVENYFNQYVIDDNPLGFFDFFKIKKFVSKVNQDFE